MICYDLLRSVMTCAAPGVLRGSFCSEVHRQVGPLSAASDLGLATTEFHYHSVAGTPTVLSLECNFFNTSILSGGGQRQMDNDHTPAGGEYLLVHSFNAPVAGVGPTTYTLTLAANLGRVGEMLRVRVQNARPIGCGHVEGVAGVTLILAFTAVTPGMPLTLV